VPAIFVTGVAALLVADLVATIPAHLAARTRPALVLRTE
jgi:hypothetical protein